MKIRNLTAKEKQKWNTWLRALIQLFYFLLFPSVYTAAFAGVKYIFTQLGAGEKVEMTSFVTVLLAICIYTIVFGRFFCGFACAFGSFGDAVHAVYQKICKKRKKKPVKLPDTVGKYLVYLKYLVLFLIVLLCYAEIYVKTQGSSPWDVFSMLHAGNFHLHGYLLGLVILLAVMVGMCVQERFFCRFLCPMGAIFSLLPVLPFFSLHRTRENCRKGCKACGKTCPSGIALPQDGSLAVSGDCFQCQKCTGICPQSNIHCGIKKIHGNEWWFTILRAVLLLGLYLWLGI